MSDRMKFLVSALAALLGTTAAQAASPSVEGEALWKRSQAAAERGYADIARIRNVQILILDGEKAERSFAATIRMERDDRGEWSKRVEPREGSTLPPGAATRKTTPLGADAENNAPRMDEMEAGRVFGLPLTAISFTGRTERVNGENCLEASFDAEGARGTILFRESDGLCAAVNAEWDKAGDRGVRKESATFESIAPGMIRPARMQAEAERRIGLFLKRTVRVSVEFADYARR